MAVTIVTALLFSALGSDAYRATVDLLVDASDLEPSDSALLTPHGASAIVPRYLPPDNRFGMAQLRYELNIASSESVARAVVKLVGLDQNPQSIASWEAETHGQGDLVSWYAQQLQQGLAVQVSPGSSIIHVSFFGPDPQGAATIANAFGKAVLQVNEDLRQQVAKPAADAFGQHSVKARENLYRAWKRLSDFQTRYRIADVSDVLEPGTATTLKSLTTMLGRASLQVSAGEKISKAAAANPVTAPNQSESNPAIDPILSDLVESYAQLAALRKEYGEADPQIAAAHGRIAALERQLANERSLSATGAATEARGSQDTFASLNRELGLQRRLSSERQAIKKQAVALVQDLISANAIDSLTFAAWSDAQSRAGFATSHISVLSWAHAPVTRWAPDYFEIVLEAGAVGLLLGLSTALALEWLSPRVRGVHHLQELGLPVLMRFNPSEADTPNPALGFAASATPPYSA